MYCVFSKALLQHYAELCGVIPTVDDYNNIKPSKLLTLKVNAIQYAFCYNRLNPDTAYDYLLGPLSNYKVHKITDWAYSNIISQLKFISQKTLNVKKRIIIGMFNNLVNKGELKKEIAIEIINNFNANIKDLHYDVSIEDLPF